MSGKILVVEDEPKLASLLSDYLRASGFEPSCLGNGTEVVPWVREH
jgi:two-component system response regulator BaeR